MTIDDIIHDVRSQINEPDSNNSHVTNTELLAWANECTEQLISLLRTFPKTQVDMEIVGNPLTLDPDIISIDYASIKLYDSPGVLESKWRVLDIIDFDNFILRNPDWQNVLAGTAVKQPEYLVRMNASEWMIYPLWDGTIANKYPVTIIGRVLPDAITDTTDEPPLPKVLHPAYVYYILWKVWPRLNNVPKSIEAFKAFDTMRIRNNRSATQTQRGLLHFRVGG